MKSFFKTLKNTVKINKLEKFARKNFIPVVRPKTKKILLKQIDKNCLNILEVGTAIGYSGSLMLLKNKSANLTTIEKDEKMFDMATVNFKNFEVSDRVNQIKDDCIKVLKENKLKENSFDFIFLDGPKGQYVYYLPYLKNLLKVGGKIFIDDVFYHGLVNGPEHVKHKHRTIVNRLREFIEVLKNDKTLNCRFYEIEDGFVICEKNS